ncbi:MAG: hypothetical protein GXP32_06450 [Kiritimatiellaeota bacterium]|nr:hypothetical protein [Kiritimatiellota bacterium]
MATRIKDGSKIVMIGDSITDCGRRDPQFGGLGNHGYVRIFAEMMTTREPEKKVEILNRGIEDSNRGDVLKRLPAYVAALEELSVEFGTAFIDMRKLFMRQLQYQHPDVYCQEPVHPNSVGHMLIAEAVYASFS